jgi:hypothetical protein
MIKKARQVELLPNISRLSRKFKLKSMRHSELHRDASTNHKSTKTKVKLMGIGHQMHLERHRKVKHLASYRFASTNIRRLLIKSRKLNIYRDYRTLFFFCFASSRKVHTNFRQDRPKLGIS